VAEGAHAVVILGGAGYHGAGHIEIPASLTRIRLPPYAPELNLAENIWEYLRKNKLANGIFQPYDDIVEAAATHGASSRTSRCRRLNHETRLGKDQYLGPLV
jgi:transposase